MDWKAHLTPPEHHARRLPQGASGCSKGLHRAPPWHAGRGRALGPGEGTPGARHRYRQAVHRLHRLSRAGRAQGRRHARAGGRNRGRGDDDGRRAGLHVRRQGAGGLGPAHQLSAATRPAPPLHLSKNTPTPARPTAAEGGARARGMMAARREPRPAIRPPGPSLRVAAPSSRRAAAPPACVAPPTNGSAAGPASPHGRTCAAPAGCGPPVMVSLSHASGTDLRKRTGGSRRPEPAGRRHLLDLRGPRRPVLQRHAVPKGRERRGARHPPPSTSAT